MFELIRTHWISSAHHLEDYDGKCANLHGHNYKIQVHLIGDKLNKTGMLMDYKLLDDILASELEDFDHTDLNTISGLEKHSTAENLAELVFKKLKHELPLLYKITIWETKKNGVSYSEE